MLNNRVTGSLHKEENVTLINRTLVVKEGHLQKIGNNSLHLETKDDKVFAFRIEVAPQHGEFHRKDPGGQGVSREIRVFQNFTTADIAEGRIYYRHDNSETQHDAAYLVAQPAYRKSAVVRIPFWYRIRIVLDNDNAPKRVFPFGRKNSVFQVKWRSEKVVTNKDLRFVDGDSDFNSQNLRFLFADDNYDDGMFHLVHPPHLYGPVHNFTQKQIDEGKLVFRHLGHSSRFRLPFYVTDGQKRTDDFFEVNATQPFLRTLVNTGLVVEKNATVSIGPQNLTMSTNLHLDASKIIFRVLKQPTAGILWAGPDGTVIDSFTQKDIDESLIRYTHQGNRTNALKKDAISLRAYADQLEMPLDFKVFIQPDEARPLLRLVTLKELVVPEGGVATVDSNVLKATHRGLMASDVKFILVHSPKCGQLIKLDTTSSQLVKHRNFVVTNFTQFQINSNALKINVHDCKFGIKTDRLVFNVQAGAETIGPFTLVIKIDKIQVTLEVRQLSVMAAGRAYLDATNIIVRNSFYESPKFEIRILTPPKNGWLELNFEPEKQLTRFSSADLYANKVFYRHSGNVSWADNFTLVAGLEENSSFQSAPRTVNVSIIHPNIQAPRLVRNEPLNMWSKPSALITSTRLWYTDADTPPKHIEYQLVMDPEGGFVAFTDQPAKPIRKFSQQDVNRNKVLFIKLLNATTGRFSFVVTDGAHSSQSTFSVESSDLSVALRANSRLSMAPRTERVIGVDLLNASVMKALPWQIIFNVTRPPRLGDLELRGRRITRFTQQDVNQRLLTYNQNKPVHRWQMKDSFHFSIAFNSSTQTTEKLEDGRFKVFISYAFLSVEEAKPYVHRSPVVVPEGGSLAINGTHLNVTALQHAVNAQLVIRLRTNRPEFGWVQFRGKNVSARSKIILRQHDLEHHLLVYHHNPAYDPLISESDHLSFEVFPDDSLMKKAPKLEFQLALRIVPVDKKQFVLTAVPNVLEVVRGTSTQIDPAVLQTEDPDTPPSRIVYTIVQGLNGVGHFAYQDSRDVLNTFTQADINKEKVRFVQYGNQSEGAFTFRVSDGQFQPITRVVYVNVISLTLTLVNSTKIELLQGEQPHVTITRAHLGAQSNGPRNGILYNVTVAPKNGSLVRVKSDAYLSNFTQADIDTNQILYYAKDLESWRDEFKFDLVNGQNRFSNRLVEIRVKPAVTQKTASVKPGGFLIISSDLLNASKLDGKNPHFLIISKPRYGKLCRVKSTVKLQFHSEKSKKEVSKRDSAPKSKGTNATFDRNSVMLADDQFSYSEENVSNFTYDDLKLKVIHYVNTPSEWHNPLTDKFVYELRARGVQPARGTFTIKILTSELPTEILQPSGNDSETGILTPGKPVWRLPSITQNWLMILFIIIAIGCLAFVIIICRRLRINRRRKRLAEKQLQQTAYVAQQRPAPTPQPDLLGSTVYAQLRPRTASIRKNGANVATADSGSSTALSRSISAAHKGTQITPPTSFHTLNARPTSQIAGSPGDLASRMVTFDPGRTELISSVPMCKVTPLTPRGASGLATVSGGSVGDEAKYAYQYSSSASDTELKAERTSLDRATAYRNKKSRTPSAKPTKLKENQYWV